jgi:hypothetical protein
MVAAAAVVAAFVLGERRQESAKYLAAPAARSIDNKASRGDPGQAINQARRRKRIIRTGIGLAATVSSRRRGVVWVKGKESQSEETREAE